MLCVSNLFVTSTTTTTTTTTTLTRLPSPPQQQTTARTRRGRHADSGQSFCRLCLPGCGRIIPLGQTIATITTLVLVTLLVKLGWGLVSVVGAVFLMEVRWASTLALLVVVVPPVAFPLLQIPSPLLPLPPRHSHPRSLLPPLQWTSPPISYMSSVRRPHTPYHHLTIASYTPPPHTLSYTSTTPLTSPCPCPCSCPCSCSCPCPCPCRGLERISAPVSGGGVPYPLASGAGICPGAAAGGCALIAASGRGIE